jgi:hypothetical protein
MPLRLTVGKSMNRNIENICQHRQPKLRTGIATDRIRLRDRDPGDFMSKGSTSAVMRPRSPRAAHDFIKPDVRPINTFKQMGHVIAISRRGAPELFKNHPP